METRQNKKEFEKMIAGFDNEIQKLALATRAFILEIIPKCYEVVWSKQKVVGYGTGIKKKTEHFANICVYKNKVNLGFTYGSELPDVEKLLSGTGKLYRHVTISSLSDLKNTSLRKLMEIAIKYRVPKLQ